MSASAFGSVGAQHTVMLQDFELTGVTNAGRRARSAERALTSEGDRRDADPAFPSRDRQLARCCALRVDSSTVARWEAGSYEPL